MTFDIREFFEENSRSKTKKETTIEDRREIARRNCGREYKHIDPMTGLFAIRRHLCHQLDCDNCMGLRIKKWREAILETRRVTSLMIALISEKEWGSLSRKISKDLYFRFPVDDGCYIVYPSDCGIELDNARTFTDNMIADDLQMKSLLYTPKDKRLSGDLSPDYNVLNKTVEVETALETVSPREIDPPVSRQSGYRPPKKEEEDSPKEELRLPEREDVDDNPFVALGLVKSDKPYRVEVWIKKIVDNCPLETAYEIMADIIEETRHINPDGVKLQDAISLRQNMYISAIRQKGYVAEELISYKTALHSDMIDWEKANSLPRDKILEKLKENTNLDPVIY